MTIKRFELFKGSACVEMRSPDSTQGWSEEGNLSPLEEAMMLSAELAHRRQKRENKNAKARKKHRQIKKSKVLGMGYSMKDQVKGDPYKVGAKMLFRDAGRAARTKAIDEVAKVIQKTIKFSRLRRLSICDSERLPKHVVINGTIHDWVGIGWVDTRAAPSMPDQAHIPVVIDG